MTMRQLTIDSPIGRLILLAEGDALTRILFANQNPADVGIEPDQLVETADDPLLAMVAAQLREYFDGGRTEFDVDLRLDGTEFQNQAWTALADIPFGETTTYGAQAAAIGSPKASRAVGAANGQNPIPIILPCHRIVGSDGSLTGFGGGLETKRWLLEHEQGAQRLPLDL